MPYLCKYQLLKIADSKCVRNHKSWIDSLKSCMVQNTFLWTYILHRLTNESWQSSKLVSYSSEDDAANYWSKEADGGRPWHQVGSVADPFALWNHLKKLETSLVDKILRILIILIEPQAPQWHLYHDHLSFLSSLSSLSRNSLIYCQQSVFNQILGGSSLL